MRQLSDDVVLVAGDNELNVEMWPSAGEGLIWGVVTDSLTGAVLPDVKITCDGLVRYTAFAGQYEIRDLDIREYELVFSKEGYETVTRYATPDTELNLSLPPITEFKLISVYLPETQVPASNADLTTFPVEVKFTLPPFGEDVGYALLVWIYSENVPGGEYFGGPSPGGYYEKTYRVGTYRLVMSDGGRLEPLPPGSYSVKTSAYYAALNPWTGYYEKTYLWRGVDTGWTIEIV